MPTECVPVRRCGTYAPGWLNGLHPTVQEGIVTRQVCFHLLWNCCRRRNNIRIKNCGAYFVYKLYSTRGCPLRYCGSYGENPSLRLSDKTASLFAGKRQDFDCITSGWPLPTVKWLTNGNELKDGEMNQTVYLKNKTEGDYYFNLTLVIFYVDLRHTGNYTCEVTNKYGTKKCSMFVTVSCPPALPELTALTPKFGKNANVTLSCEAYYLNQEQIDSYHWAWKFKDSTEIKEDDYGKYKIFSEYAVPNSCQQTKGLVALQIASVTKHDLGQYKCVLLESRMVLAVKDIPFYQYVSNSSKVPTRPEIVSLTTINCGRLIEVEWKQTSQIAITGYQVNLLSLMDDSKQVFNLSNRNHSIQFRVQSNTAYEVQIRAENLVGISLWARKQLTTTADEPQVLNFRANPEGCYAALSWKTSSANSCPITRYTVNFRERMKSASNKRSWKTENLAVPNITEYRLPLNCSKTYQIMLIAWNERGRSKTDGKTVAVRTVRTEKGVPFPPELIDVIEKQCGEFNVSWRPPSLDSGGGPLTDFQIQIKETSGGWRNCTTFLTNYSCLFKDLKSQAKYKIRVRALNQKGSSAWMNTSKNTGLIGPPDPPKILKVDVSGVNVTVQWTRPLERNCNITMYSLRYRAVKPTTEKWAVINITNNSIASYELHLRHSKRYNVTVFAWNDLGRSERSETWETGTEQHVPYQPIMHLDFNSSCNSISVTWSPPTRNASGRPVTEYLPQIKPAGSVVPWINCSLNSSVQSTSFMFTTLKANSKYDVKVTAKNIIGYGWPSEILEASTIEADRPDEPEFNVFTHDVKENDGCTVLVKWSEPLSNGCPILFYTIRHKQQTTDGTDNEWIEVNVTDPNTIQKELKMKCLTKYMFQVLAWNEVGGSGSSSVQHTTTRKTTEKALYVYGGLSQSNIVIITTVGLVLILGTVLLVVYMRYYKKKTKRSLKRTAKDIQILDPCQIPPIRTEFIEALGQGAFGKVHKAKLKDGLEYFAVEQDWVNTTRRQNIVAVKELHENANEEQKKEFMDEIELMKSVGKHKFVLSFLGCWTTTKPLLLIIEYIAHGDLLHWLRRKRSQITGFNLRAAETNPKHKELYAETRRQNATADRDGEAAANKTDMFNAKAEPSTSFEATKQKEADFDGKDECGIPMVVFSSSNQEEDAARRTAVDECDDDCESFDPTDLMTFAWQIARGMSYLSEKGLVHRDLAARNILVGHGKKLKIGDFGLMREVYHEVYEVKQQKKLPIKWMAPESLYEQFFSSKSDVWSYGVVLWEIATLGGSPYPLLDNADLMMLLKTEYRMEKPDLCSDNFYALMTECWKQNPDERPSFQELVGRLEKLMLQEVEYFDFDLVDETKDYYQVKESKTAEIDVEEKF